MIVVIGRPIALGGKLGETYLTPFGEFKDDEVIEAPVAVAEWLLHSGIATVARNWRWPGERKAPVPIPTRKVSL